MKLKFELNQSHLDTLLQAFTKGGAISGQEHCVLKFTQSPLGLKAAFFASDAPEVWLTFQESVFANENAVLCESARENLIDLEISVKALIHALKFACKMKKTTAKLSKNGPNEEPALLFEFRYAAEPSGQHFLVQQAIPVVVFRTDAEIREMPQLLDPDVKTEVMAFSRVKHVVEKIKTLKFHQVLLEISPHGALKLTGHSEAAEISAHIQGEEPDDEDFPASVNLQCSHFVDIVEAINSLPTTGPPLFAAKSDQYLCVWAPLSDHVGALTCVSPALHPFA